jgi:hypothetical protein
VAAVGPAASDRGSPLLLEKGPQVVAHALDRRPLAAARQPAGERRIFVGLVEQRPRSGDERVGGEIAAAEGVTVEPFPPVELALQVVVEPPQLVARRVEQRGRLLALGSLEVGDLVDPPVHRVELGVAHLLELAHPRALGGRGGPQRRLRIAIL